MTFSKIVLSNTIYRLLNVLVQVLTTMLLTRLMGVSGYGILSLLIATATIFNLFTSFGMDAGITFSVAAGTLPVGVLLWLIGRIVLLQMVLALLASLVYNWVTGHFFLAVALPGSTLWLLLLFMVSVSLTEKITALFNGYHFYTALNRSLLVSNVIILLLFAFLWYWQPLQAGQYLVCYLLAYFVQLIFLAVTFKIVSGIRFSWQPLLPQQRKQLGNYIFINYLANLAQFLAYRADFWLLDYYHNEKEVGWYALSVKLAQFFWIVPNLLASMLLPQVAGQWQQAGQETISRLVRIVQLVNLLLALICLAGIGWLIPGLFGQEYAPSVIVFAWLLPGSLLFCTTTVLAAYFSGSNQPQINLKGSLICLVMVVGLDLLLIPVYGKTGAAIASSIGYSIATFYNSWQFCRLTGRPLHSIWLPRRADWQLLLLQVQKLWMKK